MIDADEQVRRYRELMGDEAVLRQIVEGDNRRKCCGYIYADGHHPQCKSNPKVRAERNYRKHHGDTGTEAAS